MMLGSRAPVGGIRVPKRRIAVANAKFTGRWNYIVLGLEAESRPSEETKRSSDDLGGAPR